MSKPPNGAESLVQTLLAENVDVCFANPGTSEMHFVAALDRIPGMRCVLGLFEGVVTGAADGYYRIAERPAATLLHLGPGLANGLANLHNAKKARSGIVNIVGDHAGPHLALDAPLTSDVEGIARPMSHWVHTPTSAQAVAQAGREAVRQARSRPGRIATLILPADTAWGEASALPPAPPLPEAQMLAPESRQLQLAADALKRGQRTLLLLGGRALRADATAWAGRIAARTGCHLTSEFYGARLERGAGRVAIPRLPYAVEPALAALAPYDRIVLLGAKAPVAFFAYPGKPGRLWPQACECVEAAGPEHDPLLALQLLSEMLGAGKSEPACLPRDTGALPDGAFSPAGIAEVLQALIPENAIVIDEAVSTGRGFDAGTARAAPHDWLCGMGGSIGFGLPAAVGAAIAAPDRKVLALEADGSGMYTPQALWTMAREQLDVTVVIFANRAYQILRGEFAGVGAGEPGTRAADMLALDRPTIDWVALGRGLGLEARRATSLGEFATALRASLAQKGPSLVEIVL